MTIAFLTWDRVYWGSQFLLVVFAGIALVSGIVVNRRQAREIRELDIKRLELEQRVSPRRLSGEQKKSLVMLLSGKAGGVTIVSGLLDAEGSDFASDFEAALHDAGWETQRNRSRAAIKYGVSLATVEGTEPLEHTQWLSDALRAIGVAHETRSISEAERGTISPHFEKGYLYLIIDKKPPSAR